MSDIAEIAALLSELGRGIGVDLTLDRHGEAAVRRPDGMTVVFAAGPDTAMLVTEARTGFHLPADGTVPAGAILSLNRRPEIGSAAIAAVERTGEVVVRQTISVAGLHAQQFVNMVDGFVGAAEFAFAELDALTETVRDSEHAMPDGDTIFMRG